MLALPIARRLENIDLRNPRQDKQAVETSLARHCKSLGLRPLPVLWCNTLAEGWNEVYSRLRDENLAWDTFENRITGGKPWLGPRPWVQILRDLEPVPSLSSLPFLRASRASWAPEETLLLEQGPFSMDQEFLVPCALMRSAAMTAALLAQESPEVLAEPIPLLSMLAAAEAGLWVFWVRREDIVTVLRPAILFKGDRLHRDDGPALVWGDGTPWYYWHGVRVPAEAVERPESITFSGIRAERNSEVRRVLVERYGAARYLVDVGARPIHEDRCGILFSVPQPDDEPLAMVRVRNATPEPDGTLKEYFLRVPPDVKTAAEGVAWTFGLRESEYRPQAET